MAKYLFHLSNDYRNMFLHVASHEAPDYQKTSGENIYHFDEISRFNLISFHTKKNHKKNDVQEIMTGT